jgi:hypothetical protein
MASTVVDFSLRPTPGAERTMAPHAEQRSRVQPTTGSPAAA